VTYKGHENVMDRLLVRTNIILLLSSLRMAQSD